MHMHVCTYLTYSCYVYVRTYACTCAHMYACMYSCMFAVYVKYNYTLGAIYVGMNLPMYMQL